MRVRYCLGPAAAAAAALAVMFATAGLSAPLPVQLPVYAKPQHGLPPVSDVVGTYVAAAASAAAVVAEQEPVDVYAGMSDAERMRGIVYEE